MTIDGPVFANTDTNYRIDLRDILTDPDGDIDQIRIKNVYYGDESLDNTEAVPEDDPEDIRVQVGELTIGNIGNRRDLIFRRISPYMIEIFNEVTVSDIQAGTPDWDSSFPSLLNFQVEVTNGQEVGEQMEEHTWIIDVPVRVNNSYLTDSVWAAQTGVPDVELRPWIQQITPAGYEEPALNTEDYRVSAFSSTDVSHQNFENFGGIDVDLFTGEFQALHSLTLDQSGGSSELATPGLLYDSAIVHEQGLSTPIVYAVVSRAATAAAPTKIEADLGWYDELNSLPITSTKTVTQIPNTNDYLLAIRPDTIPKDTGVYGWTLDVELTIPVAGGGAEIVSIRTAGETPVIVGDQVEIIDPATNNEDRKHEEHANPFGAGWMLAGVPSFTYDQRRNADAVDDRLLVHFPGEATKIFDAGFLTLHNFGYTGELNNVEAGSSTFGSEGFQDPLEFGMVHAEVLPNSDVQITYTTGDGTQYHALVHDMHGKKVILIDRIEQPGVDFDPSNPPAGRRGLSFTWDASEALHHPLLQTMTASDGSVTNFEYDAGNQYLQRIYIGPSANPLREYHFEMTPVYDASGDLKLQELTSITESNSLTSSVTGLITEDAIRRFEYDQGVMKLSKWENSGAIEVQTTHVDFIAGSSLPAKVRVGGNLLEYDIEPAAVV
ncbi:MAG: hypothetical protein MI861_11965, partial [Pirellulales bacterium]|nr:hypothetical protein [Pirellulales bacterium]